MLIICSRDPQVIKILTFLQVRSLNLRFSADTMLTIRTPPIISEHLYNTQYKKTLWPGAIISVIVQENTQTCNPENSRQLRTPLPPPRQPRKPPDNPQTTQKNYRQPIESTQERTAIVIVFIVLTFGIL